jgi:hypothetical protein
VFQQHAALTARIIDEGEAGAEQWNCSRRSVPTTDTELGDRIERAMRDLIVMAVFDWVHHTKAETDRRHQGVDL